MGWPLRALLLMAGALAACAEARAEEDAGEAPQAPFRGIAGVLGASVPADRGEGRWIPVVALGTFDQKLPGIGWPVEFGFITTWLSVQVRTPASGGLFGALGLDGEFRSVDQTIYRYEDGDFLGHRVFRTSNAGGLLLAGWEIARDCQVLLRYRFHRVLFEKTDETHDGFVVPDDLNEQRLELRASAAAWDYFRDDYSIKSGWELSVLGGYARRDRWRPYGDEPATLSGDPRRFQEFTFLVGRGELALRILGSQNLRANLSAGIGDDLDRLSAFPVGSSLGDWPVAGYYYAELKADRLVLLNLSHALDLPILGLRAYLYLDMGLVRVLGERTHARTGMGVGTRIRGPLGAPILVRYGYAPRAPRGTRSRGGHEVSAQMAFGF